MWNSKFEKLFNDMSLKDDMESIYQERMEEEQSRYYQLCEEKEKLGFYDKHKYYY